MRPEPTSPESGFGVRPVQAPPGDTRLGVAAAARRLGVAPATLRTWDRRYGIGPSEHVAGRHRRYSPDDVTRLELMQHALLRGASSADAAGYALAARLPRPDADRPRPVPGTARVADDTDGPDDGGPVLLLDDYPDAHTAERVRVGGRVLRLPGAGRAARGLGRAALALDSNAVRRLLGEAIGTRGVEFAWEQVARPVLVAVAQRWADTGAGVEIEHLVSECVIGAFATHAAAAAPVRNPRPVLLCGMPGELHTLPLVVLSAALADGGVGCRSLGSDLPADALVAAVRRTAPAAIVLWSQLAATADLAVLRGLPRTRPPFRTFVAGPGWDLVPVPPRVGRLESLAAATGGITAAVLV